MTPAPALTHISAEPYGAVQTLMCRSAFMIYLEVRKSQACFNAPSTDTCLCTSRCTKLKSVVRGLVHKFVQLLIYCYALDMLIY